MTIDWILFVILSAVAVLSALGMLTSKNAVYSALFLVLNFATVAVFFLILGAPFIAMVQVTVYAGAIMVLFLFVIMLLGAEQLRQASTALNWQRPLMVLLGLLFVGALGAVLFGNAIGTGDFGPTTSNAQLAAAPGFGGPTQIGLALFQKYLLPFELTSFLLLLGMIGAVVLTRDDKKKR
jgi:NADH-quinone oxidoreductase subunit J